MNAQDVMPGLRVRVTWLGSTEGFLVQERYLSCRKVGALGTVLYYVPGHGGEVWFVQHIDSEDMGAYLFDEFEPEMSEVPLLGRDILEFRGAFRCLSNFFPSNVTVDGVMYKTVENAYQACKVGPDQREVFTCLTPGEAKKYVRKFPLPSDWEMRKVWIMRMLLRQKFAPEKLLSKWLVDTYPGRLVEGNNWGDTFWGVCGGVGRNVLGTLLMQTRLELRYAQSSQQPGWAPSIRESLNLLTRPERLIILSSLCPACGERQEECLCHKEIPACGET